MEKSPRIAFFGNHNIGYDCLEWLIAKDQNVVAAVTVAKNPLENVNYKSVEDLATENGILTITPRNTNSGAFLSLMEKLNPDLFISISYREMLPKQALEIPRLGAVNLHGSMLPQYRGCAPINWAIINGETETGVTLHYMDEKPDRGDIIAQTPISIGQAETALDIWNKVTKEGFNLFRQNYPLIVSGTAPRIPQVGKPSSYFGRRQPKDGLIEWERESTEIYNQIRALTRPFPGAFSFLEGEEFFIWEAYPADFPEKLTPGELRMVNRDWFVGTGTEPLYILDSSYMGIDNPLNNRHFSSLPKTFQNV